MKTISFALVALGLITSSRPGCGPFRPERERNESEKKPLRQECNDAASRCYTSCFKREASPMCGSCCFEQMIQCDDGAKYSFASCEAIDPAPDGGMGEAPGKTPSP